MLASTILCFQLTQCSTAQEIQRFCSMAGRNGTLVVIGGVLDYHEPCAKARAQGICVERVYGSLAPERIVAASNANWQCSFGNLLHDLDIPDWRCDESEAEAAIRFKSGIATGAFVRCFCATVPAWQQRVMCLKVGPVECSFNHWHRGAPSPDRWLVVYSYFHSFIILNSRAEASELRYLPSVALHMSLRMPVLLAAAMAESSTWCAGCRIIWNIQCAAQCGRL